MHEPIPDLALAAGLAASLAVGVLVGLQRGWQQRDRPEGGRVAGLRTFGLLGLLGGLLGSGWDASPWPLVAGLLGVAALFAVAWQHAAARSGTLSITTAVAALVTLVLGAVAARGHPLHAIGAAVVVALLLDLKAPLHRGLRRIQGEELSAALQLGVLTAVVLPLLPDEGYGPYAALNPFRLWLAVIFVAALSLLGHAIGRWRGAHQGLLGMGLVGGLASSTAATLALARAARATPHLVRAAAAGAVAASAVMFVRIAVVVALLQPALAVRLGGPLLVLAASGFLACAWQWRHRGSGQPAAVDGAGRLFDLGTALTFAFALGAVAVLARAAHEHLGTAGVYGVAFGSGLLDVDPIVISTAQMHGRGELQAGPAMTAIVLAVLANMAVKAAMAAVVGGRAFGARVAAGFGVIAAAGGVLAAVA